MGSCSINNFHNRSYEINERNFDHMSWKSEQNSSNIIIAVHGYNDYSNAFKLPAEYLIKHSIELISFDLRGFGKRSDRGEWFDLEIHLDDLKIFINKIKHDNPNKNIFLLGESMGGAIALSLANRNKDIPINGVILVSPAIWNFSKTNFFKSIALRSLSLIRHIRIPLKRMCAFSVTLSMTKHRNHQCLQSSKHQLPMSWKNFRRMLVFMNKHS